ncbi:MAG: hypothetical protein WBB68_04410 [Candidatus Moraniibacteriota bacterium]
MAFNLNSSLDNFLRKTLWLWLPFYALRILLKEFGLWLAQGKK